MRIAERKERHVGVFVWCNACGPDVFIFVFLGIILRGKSRKKSDPPISLGEFCFRVEVYVGQA